MFVFSLHSLEIVELAVPENSSASFNVLQIFTRFPCKSKILTPFCLLGTEDFFQDLQYS